MFVSAPGGTVMRRACPAHPNGRPRHLRGYRWALVSSLAAGGSGSSTAATSGSASTTSRTTDAGPEARGRSARRCSSTFAAPDQTRRPRRRTDDEDAAIALWTLLRADATAASTTSTTSWSGSPACSRCGAGSSATWRTGCGTATDPPETTEPFAEALFDYVAGHDGRVPGRARPAERHRGAGARPAPAALDLPPQGGRPDRVGGAPAAGRAEGGAGRAAVRRVRRRRPEPAARPPLRARAGGRRAACRSTARTSTRRRRGARAEQRDVAVRPAPALARRGHGAPGGVRGDQLAAVAPDGAGAASGSASRRELVGYYTEHVEADAVHEQLAVRDDLRRARRGRARRWRTTSSSARSPAWTSRTGSPRRLLTQWGAA